MLEQAEKDREFRILDRERCRRDVVHWVNNWCWTYDPRERVATLPLDLFPKQADFLHWLREREGKRQNGLVEKSRDTGVTWLCCAYAVHGWLYRDGYSVGFGSRKEKYVDEVGDPDSIFEKVRILIDNLPAWMRPRGYTRDKHAAFCKVLNPVNGATITGEAGSNIGRGGRKAIYFVDEAAFIERAHLIDRSLSATTDVRIDVSTPNGPGNPFARKRHSGIVKVFTMHYRDDPRKTPEWAAKKKSEEDPVTWAQEYEIDYTASVEGITIPAAWVRAAVELKLPATGRMVAGLDIAEEGNAQSVFIPRRGPVVNMPIAWGQLNTTQTAWRARDEAQRLNVSTLHYDCVGLGLGVKGTWQSAERPLGFVADPVNTGDAPSDIVWPDGTTSKQRFLNRRAELWWLLRVRFEKAFEFREKGVRHHKPEDMISIPNHPQLIAELSQPLCFRTETGKIKIESKDDMRRRGVKSPDHADALVLAMIPDIPAFNIGVPHSRNVADSAPRGVFNDMPEGGF